MKFLYLGYRCRVPECESDASVFKYEPSWIKEAIPFKEDKEPYKCKRYRPLANTTLINHTVCMTGFDKNVTEDCSDWVFETSEKTIVNTV